MNEHLVQIQIHRVIELLGESRTSEKALELAFRTHLWADHVIFRFESENMLPQPIACKPGCNFCCFNQVELTPVESFLICNFIEQSFSKDERNKLLDRVEGSIMRRAGKTKTEIAKIRNELPCPLLIGGLCSIYPVRPLLCRAMHAFDAKQCELSLKSKNLISDEYYLHRYEIVFALIKGLTEGCQAIGCQAVSLDLSKAIKVFFERRDLLDRWIRGEKVFND
jgi:Fe-S-cluster containining protein